MVKIKLFKSKLFILSIKHDLHIYDLWNINTLLHQYHTHTAYV